MTKERCQNPVHDRGLMVALRHCLSGHGYAHIFSKHHRYDLAVQLLLAWKPS